MNRMKAAIISDLARFEQPRGRRPPGFTSDIWGNDMNKSSNSLAVAWDYTDHASHYDKRADYSQEAIDGLLKATHCDASTPVAEVGAGTGKLTKELLKRGLTVRSVEPNDAMRAYGIKNTAGQKVTWSVGTGESTGLATNSAHAVFFGSSFNVVDQRRTLAEVARVRTPKGGLAACGITAISRTRSSETSSR